MFSIQKKSPAFPVRYLSFPNLDRLISVVLAKSAFVLLLRQPTSPKVVAAVPWGTHCTLQHHSQDTSHTKSIRVISFVQAGWQQTISFFTFKTKIKNGEICQVTQQRQCKTEKSTSSLCVGITNLSLLCEHWSPFKQHPQYFGVLLHVNKALQETRL